MNKHPFDLTSDMPEQVRGCSGNAEPVYGPQPTKTAPLTFTFCPRCGKQMNPDYDPSKETNWPVEIQKTVEEIDWLLDRYEGTALTTAEHGVQNHLCAMKRRLVALLEQEKGKE